MRTPNIRGFDSQGAGYFGASRAGGSRKHNGVDFVCHPHDEIISLTDGIVTKIGYPYDPSNEKKGHMRYIQITDKDGNDVRYFYVTPHVDLYDTIKRGDKIGRSQDLTRIYPGITQHFHFEVKRVRGYLNPLDYLATI